MCALHAVRVFWVVFTGPNLTVWARSDKPGRVPMRASGGRVGGGTLQTGGSQRGHPGWGCIGKSWKPRGGGERELFIDNLKVTCRRRAGGG